MSKDDKASPPPPPPPTQEAEPIEPMQISTHSQKPAGGHFFVMEKTMPDSNDNNDD
jgi:hypothetical protein